MPVILDSVNTHDDEDESSNAEPEQQMLPVHTANERPPQLPPDVPESQMVPKPVPAFSQILPPNEGQKGKSL